MSLKITGIFCKTRINPNNGVTRDGVKARYWYEKAAAQGQAEALERLAKIYMEGLGVRQNRNQARRYYQQAATQGNAFA